MSEDAVGRLTIAPEPEQWVISDRRTPEQARFRAQLGLPTDRPVVMTGHQAGVWHAGIVAKYFAADAFAMADRVEGTAAWLVVDQDENDPLALRVPVERDGVLAVETVRLSEGAGPTGWRAPAHNVTVPEMANASDLVRRGVGLIVDALIQHAGEASLARQVSEATGELLASFAVSGRSAYASDFGRTDAFKRVVERMERDPGACAAAYNDAVAGVDGLRPLAMGERVELPIWVVEGGRRRPAYAGEIDGREIVPRALLMTGLVRLYGCDFFIHGLGGGGDDGHGGYEAAGEAWLRSWLGEDAFAPVGVVSATVLLDLPGGEAPSEADVAAAKARAHKARHDPSVIGDDAAAQKAALLKQIGAAKQAGEDPAALFKEMQALLEAYRARHGVTFEALDEDAARMEKRLGERSIREDRTFPWVFHGRATLLALRDEIRSRLL